jgi:hypothetical protein
MDTFNFTLIEELNRLLACLPLCFILRIYNNYLEACVVKLKELIQRL